MEKQLFRITGTAAQVCEALHNLARLYPKGATVAEAIAETEAKQARTGERAQRAKAEPTKSEYIEFLTACKGYTHAEAEAIAKYFYNADESESETGEGGQK